MAKVKKGQRGKKTTSGKKGKSSKKFYKDFEPNSVKKTPDWDKWSFFLNLSEVSIGILEKYGFYLIIAYDWLKDVA